MHVISWHLTDTWVDIVLRKVTLFYARWTSFDAERKATPTAAQRTIIIGTMQRLLDTKPTSETARMPVRVDMERLYTVLIETFHLIPFNSHGHPGCC